MTTEEFDILLQQYLRQQLRKEELNSFLEAASKPAYQSHMYAALGKDLHQGTASGLSDPTQLTQAYDKLLYTIREEAQPTIPNHKRIYNKSFFKYIAAAILILAIGSGLYYFNHQSQLIRQIRLIQVQTNEAGTDILPGTNRATLTINNHKTINLATNKKAININNSITYSDGEKIADAGQQMQLTTPRGGQYQAVLPDGSTIWLNAASSITFPSTFNNKERRVEITGEVYFEVAKNSKPFIVKTFKDEIKVLGTAFNVNAYTDEPAIVTTLVEGAVKINQSILKPGQQYSNERVQPAKIEEATAWKSGYFNFQREDINTIMRSLSRWYNITIVYERTINDKFNISVNRATSLSNILKILEATGRMKTQINGTTITIQ